MRPSLLNSDIDLVYAPLTCLDVFPNSICIFIQFLKPNDAKAPFQFSKIHGVYTCLLCEKVKG